MPIFDIKFRDVTQDPTAREKVAGSSFRDVLLAFSFQTVGLLESRTSETLKDVNFGAGPDVAMMRKALDEGEIGEILTSPDRRTFAVVEPYFDGPIVCFRSIFENGVIVDTTMEPRRMPNIQYPPQPAGLPQNDFIFAILMKLLELAVGKQPLWVRENFPSAGYHLELIRTEDAHFLWRRHQERISHLIQGGKWTMRPHEHLSLYVCILQRYYRIFEHKTNWVDALNWALIAVFVLVSFGAVSLPWEDILSQYFGEPGFSGNGVVWVMIALLVIITIVGIMMLPLLGFIRTRLMPYLPGPRLESVEMLLKKHSIKKENTPPPNGGFDGSYQERVS